MGPDPRAIALTVALCEYFDQRRQIIGEDTYIPCYAYASRIGGWASQQVGHRRWLKRFKNNLEELLYTKNRIVVVGYNMLKYHEEMDEYFLTGIPPLENSAIEAYKAFRNLPAGALGYIHDMDGTLLINPATCMVLLGFGSKHRFEDMGSKSLSYLLLKGVEFDEQAPHDTSSYISTLALLMRSYANDGDTIQTEMTEEKIIRAKIRSESPISLYAERSIMIGLGEVEAIRTGNLQNSHLKEARRICVQMGNLTRAVALDRRMGIGG